MDENWEYRKKENLLEPLGEKEQTSFDTGHATRSLFITPIWSPISSGFYGRYES